MKPSLTVLGAVLVIVVLAGAQRVVASGCWVVFPTG